MRARSKSARSEKDAGRWTKKIIHVDMDAFFAAVEQRDHAELRAKPVVVGGDPRSRGVVSTCSYEARKFGIRSAMPLSQAYRLCRHAVFVKPRFEVYREVSCRVMNLLRQHTDLVESVSLDEAYLDVSRHRFGIEDPVLIAALIKQNILAATRLTASAGVAGSMFLAKVASDYQKPDGLTVVRPGTENDFLNPLPVRKIPGVGPVIEKKLLGMGYATCGELAAAPLRRLTAELGRHGEYLSRAARGLDEREVSPWTEPKQSSLEETFDKDTRDLEFLRGRLRAYAEEIYEDLLKTGRVGRTIVLKVKYADFRLITRSQTLTREPACSEEIYRVAAALLEEKTRAGKDAVRLLGLGIAGLVNREEIRTLKTPDMFASQGILL